MIDKSARSAMRNGPRSVRICLRKYGDYVGIRFDRYEKGYLLDCGLTEAQLEQLFALLSGN